MANIGESIAKLDGKWGEAEFKDGILHDGIVRIKELATPLHFERDGKLKIIPLRSVRTLTSSDIDQRTKAKRKR
jgi:hypothetical protein